MLEESKRQGEQLEELLSQGKWSMAAAEPEISDTLSQQSQMSNASGASEKINKSAIMRMREEKKLAQIKQIQEAEQNNNKTQQPGKPVTQPIRQLT